MADALCVNSGLIKLAANNLGEEGIKLICDALKVNKTITELNICGATFKSDNIDNIGGPAGAKHIADMLLVNGVLTSVRATLLNSVCMPCSDLCSPNPCFVFEAQPLRQFPSTRGGSSVGVL